MGALALVGAIVGLVGGLCGIASLIYVRRQTLIMQRQLDDAESEKSGFVNWSEKYEQASTALVKIYSKLIYTGPSPMNARDLVFPDGELRESIERHLRKGWWGFKPAALSREQLGSPVVQQLIEAVLASVDRFKQEHPDWARTMGLLPK